MVEMDLEGSKVAERPLKRHGAKGRRLVEVGRVAGRRPNFSILRQFAGISTGCYSRKRN